MREVHRRVPCGEDMCTGVYGPDGVCGTCGRGVLDADPQWLREEVAALRREAAEGAPEGPVQALEGPATESDPGEAAEAPAEAVGVEAAPAREDLEAAAETDDDAASRVPCDDDMCTGIYNAAGVCGTCGRARAEG